MTTIILTRHGETAWNRDGRVQGWAPTPITDRGREQARRLTEHLRRGYAIDRIHASDLRRTRETAHIVRSGAVTDLDVEYDPGWRERDFGTLQGLTDEAVFEGHPEFSLAEVGIEAARATPHDGESLLDMRERVLRRWDELVATAGSDETLLLVTHGGPLYAILGAVRGWDIVRSVLDRDQGNCTVNEVAVRDGVAEIVREDEFP